MFTYTQTRSYWFRFIHHQISAHKISKANLFSVSTLDINSLKHSGVILVSPDENLSDGTECFNDCLLVILSDVRVSLQHLVLVPGHGERHKYTAFIVHLASVLYHVSINTCHSVVIYTLQFLSHLQISIAAESYLSWSMESCFFGFQSISPHQFLCRCHTDMATSYSTTKQ